MVSQYLNKVFSSIASISLDTLAWIIWGSFAAITFLILVLTLALPKFKAASKRPYLCLVNAYAAVTLAAFLTAEELAQSALAAVLFWCTGYILFGILCFLTKPATQSVISSQTAITSLPVQVTPKAVNNTVRTAVPAAKSSVRLEHAISVTDNLLLKNLGKGDRQELEKLKNTLAVLQMKGTLSPAESDILNDNFNALLKLMAKYNM